LLTKVKAYSAWASAPTLLLDALGRPDTDLIQIRNIDGLDPVKASVSTSPYGSVDGESYTGSSVPKRNIVLTLRPNPDWDNWTPETLRRLIYAYFMPKLATRLVFDDDDLGLVEIFGIVESVENNIFSKDPEFIVSVICPDPYFTAVEPTILTGQTIDYGGIPTVVPYEGNIETGFKLKVTWAENPVPLFIALQVGDPISTYITIETTVDATKYFEMNSVPRNKYVQSVNINTAAITNLLTKVGLQIGSPWPVLQPGDNDISVITFEEGTQDFELSYYARYGGL